MKPLPHAEPPSFPRFSWSGNPNRPPPQDSVSLPDPDAIDPRPRPALEQVLMRQFAAARTSRPRAAARTLASGR